MHFGVEFVAYVCLHGVNHIDWNSAKEISMLDSFGSLSHNFNEVKTCKHLNLRIQPQRKPNDKLNRTLNTYFVFSMLSLYSKLRLSLNLRILPPN